MTRKTYLQLHENSYGSFEFAQNLNFDLNCFINSFDLTNEWLRIDHDNGVVTIWNSYDLKDQERKNFISKEDKKKYDDEYAKYSRNFDLKAKCTF